MADRADRLPVRYEVVEVARLHAHEEVEEDRLGLVIRGLTRDGQVTPVVADAATGVILDGHHRFNALRRMGYTRIPVAFVDYSDARIRVEAWRSGETPPTKDEVLATALAGRLYPPKSTRHRFPHTLGERPVKLEALR